MALQMAINVGGLVGMIFFYILILVIGLWAARKRKKGEIEAMLAGRRIGLLIGSFTLTATWVGGGFLNGTAEMVYSAGLVWTQAPWAYGLGLCIGGLFFAKTLRQREYITLLDPFQQKYGDRMGALLFLPALCGALFYSGSILNALGATVSVILGLDKTVAVLISTAVAVTYTMFGGFISVAYTDVVQLACIAIGLILCVPFAATHQAVVPISSTSPDWLGEWSPTRTGVWLDDMCLLLMGAIPWQEFFQRFLSAKTPRIGQLMCFAGGLGAVSMSIPAAIIGAIGYSTDWTQTALYNPPPNATNYTMPSPEQSLILPLVLQYLTPNWVGIIGLGAIAAAVMSSADSSMLATSTLFTHNIYKPLFRQKASPRELMWVMRITVIVAGFLACTLALTVKSIYVLFYLCGDFVYVMLFPQLVCVVYVRHSNVYGSFTGYVIGLFLRLAGGERFLDFPALIKYPYYSDTDGQLFPYKSFAMVCTLITIIVVSYLTKYLFEHDKLPPSWDFLSVFKSSDQNSYDTEVNQQVEMRAAEAEVA